MSTQRYVSDELTHFVGRGLPTAIAEATARGAARVAEILAAPEMLTDDTIAALLGVTAEDLRRRLCAREVLGLDGSDGIRYPAWQVTAGRLLPELPALRQEMGCNSWTVYQFLLQHHPELDGATALAVLRGGEVRRVLDVVTSISMGSFS